MPHVDFDVTPDDDDDEEGGPDDDDQSLYRRPGMMTGIDGDGEFDISSNPSYNIETALLDAKEGDEELDMNWQVVGVIAKKAFQEVGEIKDWKQKTKVFQLIQKEKETGQMVTNKFMKKLMKKIDKAVATKQTEVGSEMTNKRSTDSHLRKCYRQLRTPCCKRVTGSKAPCFLCWL